VVLEVVVGATVGPQVLGIVHPGETLNFLANFQMIERPQLAPSVTAGIRTASPELRADRPYHQHDDDSGP
jgi:hypothetical protein